jgi:protein-S-isoprenylcysteine O-methyltransferase Ste14
MAYREKASGSRPMFLHALVAFVAQPGLVAYVVPLLIVRPWAGRTPFVWIGLLPLVAGTFLLLWCVRDFYVAGRGTLAPWAPPRHLVLVGLYRVSRNPMYVAVSLVLLGWALCFWSGPLSVYAGVVLLAFHLRVVLGEEPWLARRYGDEWERYRARVPRWLI